MLTMYFRKGWLAQIVLSRKVDACRNVVHLGSSFCWCDKRRALIHVNRRLFAKGHASGMDIVNAIEKNCGFSFVPFVWSQSFTSLLHPFFYSVSLQFVL